jgi:hypothetical protein
MNLHIIRYKYSKTTIGVLLVDGLFFSYSLEDEVRPSGVKVSKMTAIPAGDYTITVTRWIKHKKSYPLLLRVPGFTGIYIHDGNTANDTEGCIIIGHYYDSKERVSQGATRELVAKLGPDGSLHQIRVSNT